MQPSSFTIKDGVTHFHYNVSELRKFIYDSKDRGIAEMVLMARQDDMLLFRMFSPSETTHLSIWVKHDPLIDGVMLTDEEFLMTKEVLALHLNSKK